VPILALTLTITPPFAPAPCITLPFARGGGQEGVALTQGVAGPNPAGSALGAAGASLTPCRLGAP
jgi:hypothetical protein